MKLKMIHSIRYFSLFAAGIFFTWNCQAQDDEFADLEKELEGKGGKQEMIGPQETFYGTRIISGHSAEVLGKNVMEFRVEHRFGDIAGTNGGVQTMFGLDNSSDIRIAFEYGITDKLMIGLGRSKGAGAPYNSLLDGLIKYKFLTQEKGKSPISLAAMGMTTFAYEKASTDSFAIDFYPKTAHRFAYAAQLIAARKFHERFSMALMPTVVHRNYVASDDVNTTFAMGGAARIGLTSTMAVLLEYYHCLTSDDIRTTNHNSLGIAFEWITFGHNFTINFTNSRGFGETQFIPGTYADWLKGQFRLGFSIGRKFEF